MVVRVNKNTNYTVMSNIHLMDRNLSLKAKGLLSVVLSLPDDWEYSVTGLAAISKEKESAISSALKELKEEGYLVVTKKMPNETRSGRIEYEWDFYEHPHKQEVKKQGIENQGLEYLTLEVQGLEDQGQLNTNKVNTNILNTKEVNTKENIYICADENFFEDLPDKPKSKFIPPTIEEVAEYCNQRNSDIDPEEFWAYYASQNWKKANGRPIKDWKLCVITWEKKEARRHEPNSGNPFDNLLTEEGYT